MRRLFVVAVALLLLPALALAGKTVTQGNDTLKIKTQLDPAVASKSKNKLRAVEAKYDYVAGTKNDQRLPDLRSVKVFMGGAKFGFGAFPTCDETDAREQGEGVCPDGSKVGEGKGVAEIHPLDSQTSKLDFDVDVTLYNGELDTDETGAPMDPRPGLMVFTEVAGENVVLPFWAERHNRQVSFYNPDEDADPNQDSFYTIKEIHLTIDRMSVRQDGRRVPFLAAPTKCERKWVATTTNEFYSGQPITAKHKIRCEEA